MFKFFPVFLLLLVGCDPRPTLQCDYCHTMREGAQRYVCDKCKETHAACDVDRAVMHYEQSTTFRGRASYSATGLLTCPSPEDATTRVVEKPEPMKTLPLWMQIAGCVLTLVAFFGGYAKGRTDETRSPFCKKKECLKARGLK
jgi:hypothetical protein